MVKALVTGCAGFIGSHLTEKLLEKEWKITGIDNFHPYYSRKLKELNLKESLKNKNFQFVEGSILSDNDLKKINGDFDYIFHFAAIAGVRNSLKNPQEYIKINFDGTKKILEKFSKSKKIIFASTSSVYGEVESNDFPVKENHDLNPISPYGKSKKDAEMLCKELSKKFGFELAILRFYTVYGPRQRPDEAFTKFIRLVQNNQPIKVYGDGSKERDFTYVLDIVNGAILAAEKGNGVYNLGTNSPVRLDDMINGLEKILGKKISREYTDSPKGDVQKTHADINKAKNELNYYPETTLEEGMKQCVLWCTNTKEIS